MNYPGLTQLYIDQGLDALDEPCPYVFVWIRMNHGMAELAAFVEKFDTWYYWHKNDITRPVRNIRHNKSGIEAWEWFSKRKYHTGLYYNPNQDKPFNLDFSLARCGCVTEFNSDSCIPPNVICGDREMLSDSMGVDLTIPEEHADTGLYMNIAVQKHNQLMKWFNELNHYEPPTTVWKKDLSLAREYRHAVIGNEFEQAAELLDLAIETKKIIIPDVQPKDLPDQIKVKHEKYKDILVANKCRMSDWSLHRIWFGYDPRTLRVRSDHPDFLPYYPNRLSGGPIGEQDELADEINRETPKGNTARLAILLGIANIQLEACLRAWHIWLANREEEECKFTKDGVFIRPAICQAILDHDFERFDVQEYSILWPMFPEGKKVSHKVYGQVKVYDPIKSNFVKSYEGSCLEYMIDNNYPAKWLAKLVRWCEWPKDIEWPFVRAIREKDLDTFLEWKECLPVIMIKRMPNLRVTIEKYLRKNNYPKIWFEKPN